MRDKDTPEGDGADEGATPKAGGTTDQLHTTGRSKVATVEGWEPFERVERSEIDDN